MSNTVRRTLADVGDVGRSVPALPALSSALRPAPLVELGHWGGAALVRGKRVLDLGCGDGRLAIGLARYAKAVVGVDPYDDVIRTARARARATGLRNVRFAVGAAQSLSLPDGAFDVVVLSWTL